MRSFIWINHIDNARQSLSANRMRSYLTMLGVTIGVASITAILALSVGASKVVSDQVDDLGGNIAVIRPGSQAVDPLNRLANPKPNKDYATSTLTEEDISRISKLKEITAVAPLMLISGTLKGEVDAPARSTVVATTPELADISRLTVREGQFLSDDVNENTAVIGSQLAVDIFGTDTPIGYQVHVRGESFTIIGVLKRLSNPINYNNVDFDNSLIINLGAGKGLAGGNSQIQQINIQSTSVASLQRAIIDVNKQLLASHAGEQDFTVLSGEEISQPTSDLFYTIAGVTAAVAGISLLVGGVGVMNIMLVSVAERTREIGIRKALGASNGDIARQFLIESLAISLGGGIGGFLLGYAAAFIISTFLTFDPVINWEIGGIALGISVIMGTLFGIYPAMRAARKDPIESLRQYE